MKTVPLQCDLWLLTDTFFWRLEMNQNDFGFTFGLLVSKIDYFFYTLYFLTNKFRSLDYN